MDKIWIAPKVGADPGTVEIAEAATQRPDGAPSEDDCVGIPAHVKPIENVDLSSDSEEIKAEEDHELYSLKQRSCEAHLN